MLYNEVSNQEEDKKAKSWFIMKCYMAFNATTQFNILSKFGVCIISALSGFSVVNMPFFFFQYYDPTITNIKKGRIEDDIRNIWQDIRQEKLELIKIYNPNNKDLQVKNNNDNESSSVVMSIFFGKKKSKYEKSIHNTEKSVRTSQRLMDSLF